MSKKIKLVWKKIWYEAFTRAKFIKKSICKQELLKHDKKFMLTHHFWFIFMDIQ